MKPSARKKSQRGSKYPAGPAGHGATHQQSKRGVQGFMGRNHNARRACRVGMLAGCQRRRQRFGLVPTGDKVNKGLNGTEAMGNGFLNPADES